MSPGGRVPLALALVLQLTGCASWAGLSLEPPLPSGERLQVWAGDAALEIGDLAATGDSIAGVDRHGVRRAFGRAEIDSIRVRRFDAGKTFLTVFGIVPAAALMTLYLLAPPAGR